MKLAALNLIFAMILLPLGAAVARDDAKEGEQLWKTKCAMCHGPDGAAGTAMGKKLNMKPVTAPEIQKKTDAELAAIVTKGKDKMPPYDGKLTKEQIQQVVAYMRTLAKGK
jgi:mono/diheme cytochrome c family protein